MNALGQLTHIDEYVTGNTRVRFCPMHDVPGYTHRVVIIRNGERIGTEWLAKGFKPSAKSATYFLEKHTLINDDLDNR